MMYRKLQLCARTIKTQHSTSIAAFSTSSKSNFSNNKSVGETDNKFMIKILQKSEQGRSLAQKVTNAAPLDKFEREQRYETFIQKMNQLYQSERRFKRKANQAFTRMKSSHLLYQTPIKQVLSEYNKLTIQGFNCEVLASSLEHLQNAVEARGNKPRVYADFSLSEMDQSWRMEKIASDINFALTSENNAFFSAKNMARASRSLGELGYKNTEVIDHWLKNLTKILNGEKQGLAAMPDFESAVFGDFKNFKARHYIFQGFESDNEFRDHLQTLAMFKLEQNQFQTASNDESVQEVEQVLQKLVEAAKEMREVQIDQQAAIESLRTQYFKLQAAQNKHEFLAENKYLMFDMLELQEMLVKGGYLDPHEALVGQHDSVERRMERASSVFYEMALSFNPELLSPQYNAFYDAATSKPADDQTTVTTLENHNDMSLGNVSDILVGLAEQSLSFRRDAKDKDYPNKQYEDLLMPEERRQDNKTTSFIEQNILQKYKAQTVLMERSYLNAWRNFQSHSQTIISQHFQKLAGQGCTATDLLKALRALSACKIESKTLRDQITPPLLSLIKISSSSLPQQDYIDGLVGIADCHYKPSQSDQLVKNICAQINPTSLTFKQQVDVLHALACMSTGVPESIQVPLFEKVMAMVDGLAFERVDHELTHGQYEQLHDVHVTLKFNGRSGFQNNNLNGSMQTYSSFLTRFSESASGRYDPLKSRVVSGLAKGLNQADIQSVKLSQDFDQIQNNFALQPDLVTGVQGDKVALYVLNNREIMSDSKHADGRISHLIRLTTKDVKPVGIALDSIVDYDLNTFQLKIKDDFSLDSILSTQPQSVSMTKLAQIAVNLAENNTNFSTQLKDLMKQFADFFERKDRVDHLFEPEQLIAANDELKLSLMKLSLMHDVKLSEIDMEKVQKLGQMNFKNVINEVKSELNVKSQALFQKLKYTPQRQFKLNWQGARLSMELPPLADQTVTKSIYSELLSRKFLQRGDYHQYDDWKETMQATFDQFNLMQIKESDSSVNFDLSKHNRKIPQGIFPLPNRKRKILQQNVQLEPKKFDNHDRFVKFEADPFSSMIQQEMELSSKLKEITPEISMIINLQNIKYGLLADFSDEEICKTLLLSLSFTDSLIESHLRQQKENQENGAQFLSRDPSAFRKYQESQVRVQSPFNKFFLKEALKQSSAKELHQQIVAKQNKNDFEGIETLKKQLDNILIKIDRENEDNFSLSKGLDNYVQVNVDVKSLGVLDSPNSISQDDQLSDAEFLDKQRCVAESTLIKSKLIFKLHYNLELSPLEFEYLSTWRKAMQNPTTLINECMVPHQPSKVTLSQLSPEDIYTLNSIPRVQIDREQHAVFALNDLAVELAQVFDHDTVRQVEISCLEDSLKKEWNLQQDFKLTEQRNKEIDIVQEELEEIAWRTSGQFTHKEAKAVKNMFVVGRGQDHFDRQYLNQDVESLEQFIAAVNPYDSRITMLEKWLSRKEHEVKNRVNLPTPDLQKSDYQLYNTIEARHKPAREKLVSQMLVQDEFGVAKTSQKAYKHLSSSELHQIVEGLCPRLNLFSRQYPAFLPQTVRAIMEHSNLQRSDRETLDAYCKMFELDWRADHTITNRDEMMATNPVYLNMNDRSSLEAHGKIGSEHVSDRLRRASQPYLGGLAQKIMGYNKSA